MVGFAIGTICLLWCCVAKSITGVCIVNILGDYNTSWFYRAADVSEKEYNDFYKAFTKDYEEPLAKIHFTAEGEVSFKSILFIPKKAPSDVFQKYGTKTENIKVSFLVSNCSYVAIPDIVNFSIAVVRQKSFYH